MQTISNDPVMDIFAKLDLKKVALLLDVDGTIIDIGPSPTEVQVSGALLKSLNRLFEQTDGAVALGSSGRLGVSGGSAGRSPFQRSVRRPAAGSGRAIP